MNYNQLYFYTSTIRKWVPLIRQYHFESVIINSFNYLHNKNCIKVYGFVIMPNHIHLIWEMLRPNGRESPLASLMKFTAHEFEKYLRLHNPSALEPFVVEWKSRKINFWQPDSDEFLLVNEDTILQKLIYIHNNPLQEHWNLVNDPISYQWSSARFYETGEKNFSFLFDYRDYQSGY